MNEILMIIISFCVGAFLGLVATSLTSMGKFADNETEKLIRKIRLHSCN